MGIFDIIHFTEASLEQKEDEPSVWACYGFYPKEITWTNLVYEAVLYGEHLDKPQKAIVKMRRFRPGTEQFWQSRLDANTHAAGVSAIFTEKTGAGKLHFVRQYLAPLKGYSKWEKFCRSMKQHDFRDFEKGEIVLIQPLVSDCMNDFQEDIVLDAFSHFSYVEGKHQSVISVFKGCKNGNEYHLITPKILTSQKEINEFFSEHTCNDLCSGWSKPSVSSNNPLFDLHGDNLKLQRQTSVRVEEPGQHVLQMMMPEQYCGILKHPTAPIPDDSLPTPRKKVTTIMHAVYVHEDPKHEEKEKRTPVQKMLTAPYLDTASRKGKSGKNQHVIINDTEQTSPVMKNKPVRVYTMDSQNVRMPKRLNIRHDNKPEIKPKPEIKQKPEVKPKPGIKPKPKLQRQDRTIQESDSDDKIDAQKMAVQDELKARLSKISNKELDLGANLNDNSNPETEKIFHNVYNSESEINENCPTAPAQVSESNMSSTSVPKSPSCRESITEKKVKSKKSLRKQAALAT